MAAIQHFLRKSIHMFFKGQPNMNVLLANKEFNKFENTKSMRYLIKKIIIQK